MTNKIIEYAPKSPILVEEDVRQKYESIESDLNAIQQNLQTTAEKLQTELPLIIEFTRAAQHPKMYEALSKVIAAISTVNRDAAAVLRQKKELLDSLNKNVNNKSTDEPTTNIDQRSIHFHGTSVDLLDRILKKKEE